MYRCVSRVIYLSIVRPVASVEFGIRESIYTWLQRDMLPWVGARVRQSQVASSQCIQHTQHGQRTINHVASFYADQAADFTSGKSILDSFNGKCVVFNRPQHTNSVSTSPYHLERKWRIRKFPDCPIPSAARRRSAPALWQLHPCIAYYSPRKLTKTV